MDDQDWKFRMSLGKVPVVYLNSSLDYVSWRNALRRLVTTYNMQHALIYTIPSDRIDDYKARLEPIQVAVKKEYTPTPEVEGKDPVPLPPAPKGKVAIIDLVDVEPYLPTPVTAEQTVYMRSMGVSPGMEEFFASTITFVDVRSWQPETEKQHYFRQEIWQWLDQSLAKGNFKWVVRSISPVLDIHALFSKVDSLANKATLISHALECKKIFTMVPGPDIFLYHADLIQQIKLVKLQGESLGLASVIPPWMEQSLLLIAAWGNVHYRKIALEFTMEDKAVSVESLVRELQKQQLLTAHLNQSGSGGGSAIDRRDRRPERADVRVRAATASTSKVLLCISTRAVFERFRLSVSA